MPKAFSDTYSFAVDKFMLDEPVPLGEVADGGVLGAAKPQKGMIGWLDEADLVVVGAGYNATWEKFTVQTRDDGRRFIERIAWKHYYKETLQ